MDSALPVLASGSMDSALHLLAPGVVLAVTLAVGIAVHELLHVIPLWFTGATFTVTVLPVEDSAPAKPPAVRRSGGPTPRRVWATLQGALTGSLVRVEVTHLPAATPDWVVRTAALLPVVLALPFALVAAGVLPNPFAVGDHLASVALVTLTACGLPSPADWAVVWHGSDLHPA